jgi:outer membrane protein assembly factor BamB/predicted phosphodiesterase
VRLAALLLITFFVGTASARPIRGLVFDDRNGDGRPSAGEPGVPNAVVAYDVKKFVQANSAGVFEMELPEGGNGIVWVRIPDGFVPGAAWARVPKDDASIDIPLHRHIRLDRRPITFVIASDTHLEAVQPFANDLGGVVADATALDPAPAFITILGDITQGNTPEQFDLVDASLAGLTIPYVPVPGNHDWYDGGATWFQRYGPDNYSFDIDKTHFVVWNMSMSTEEIVRYLGAELARVGPDMTVVALTHAPPVPAILAMLRDMGVDYVLSGHTHTNRAVDHGGLIELTTEPLLMGGLDLMPAGYRVATMDRGQLSTYHRTVVDIPLLAVIAPGHGQCISQSGGSIVVAAELDAGSATLAARVDCATPIAMRFAGGWNWRAELPALAPGPHSLLVEARSPSGTRVSKVIGFDVCPIPEAVMPDVDWPQTGGSPRHDGAAAHAIAPPLEQRWAATVGGQVLHAAPVVAGNTVFVSATDLGDGHTGGVVAFDLATGATKWRVATASPVRGSPAVAGTTVAVGSLDGTVLGLDMTTGEQRWRYELGAGLPAEAASLFAAPAADGGDFLVGNQRHLAALASDVGAALWRVEPVPGGTYSQSLAAVAVGDGVAVGVFHRELGGVIAWDRATGVELWRQKGALATAINATPVIGTDTVYIVNGMTEVIALELTTGVVRWQTKLDPQGFDWGNATVGTPALAHDILVVPVMYRDLVALDAKTGAELWRHAGTPSPLRTTHYRGANESGFESSPAITGDIVWAADTAGRLSALELSTGRALWATDLETPVLAGLAVAGDWLLVASYDGSVRAFSRPTRDQPQIDKPPGCEIVSPAGCCDARGERSLLPALLVLLILLRIRR